MILVYPSLLDPIVTIPGSLSATYCPQDSTVVGSPLVTLLHLKADGNLTDSSGFNRTSTSNGGGTFSSTFKKYGTHSFQFTATNSQVVSIIPNTEAQGDLTIEFWAMIPTLIANRGIFSLRQLGGGSSAANSYYLGASPNFFFTHLGSSTPFASYSGSGLGAYTPSSSWSHYAVVYNNLGNNGVGIASFFVNGLYRGTFAATNTVSANFDGVGIVLGAYSNNTLVMNGYMDSFRITRGQRYRANFDPELDTGLAY